VPTDTEWQRSLSARQHENYRFPSDDEFERQLKDADLYGLRICRHLLEGLENHGTKEPTDTSSYSIEHIMPQNERLSRGWRDMLGESWKDNQKTWLHRLGNLTLTGYNSARKSPTEAGPVSKMKRPEGNPGRTPRIDWMSVAEMRILRAAVHCIVYY
jgi:hypothetical protein